VLAEHQLSLGLTAIVDSVSSVDWEPWTDDRLVIDTMRFPDENLADVLQLLRR
jgi:hypothetical protein